MNDWIILKIESPPLLKCIVYNFRLPLADGKAKLGKRCKIFFMTEKLQRIWRLKCLLCNNLRKLDVACFFFFFVILFNFEY